MLFQNSQEIIKLPSFQLHQRFLSITKLTDSKYQLMQKCEIITYVHFRLFAEVYLSRQRLESMIRSHDLARWLKFDRQAELHWNNWN